MGNGRWMLFSFYISGQNKTPCSIYLYQLYVLISYMYWPKIYKIIIFSMVLYGYETWSPTLMEEHRLRVFENRLLRLFGLKRNEIVGGWKKFHNKELHNLYCSRNRIRMFKSRRMRWTGFVVCMGRRQMNTRFWWESENEINHYQDLHVGGRIILK